MKIENDHVVFPQPEPVPASRKDKRLANQGKAHQVVFPVSYSYNGGMEYKGQWYKGFKVPRPKVPKGWELIDIGVGLQLNARPPFSTMALRPLSSEKAYREAAQSA
jgi:hypothetical protein